MLMNYRNIFQVVIFVFALPCFFQCNYDANTGADSKTYIPDHLKGKVQLVWNDEFDGMEIDTTKWNYRAEGTVRYYAKVSRNTIKLDGMGHLIIMVTSDSSGNYYNVGQLGTQGIFETRYGYFECRAKMNRSIGPHVSFWLQSPTIASVGNPAVYGTEIDIFEYHRKTPGMVYHTLHWDGYEKDHKTTGVEIPVQGIDEGFHTFGLEWNQNGYIFYVNGKETWKTSEALSHRNQYMILSTELTGFGGDPSEGTFPDTVVFDYVRVYKML